MLAIEPLEDSTLEAILTRPTGSSTASASAEPTLARAAAPGTLNGA